MIFARRTGLGVSSLIAKIEANPAAVNALLPQQQQYYTQTDIVNAWHGWVCPGGLTSDGACNADGTSAFPAAMIATLQPCPAGGTVTASNGANLCFGARKLGNPANNDIYTIVPGIFNVLGVLFSVAEIQSNKLVKTVIPTSDMRLEAELRLIATSMYNINKAIADYDSGNNPEYSSTIFNTNVQSISGTSINALAKAIPDFTYQPQVDLNIPFNHLPIPPTSSELTSTGGYASWLQRGGFPLSKSTLQGQRALIEGFQWGKAFGDFDTEVGTSISVAVTPPCNCNGTASQQIGWLTNSGIQVSGSSDTTNEWWTFAALNSDGTITVTYAYQDPSWWQDVGQTLAKGLQDLGKLGCIAAPALVKVPAAQGAALIAAGLCVAELAQASDQATNKPVSVAAGLIAQNFNQIDQQITTQSAAQQTDQAALQAQQAQQSALYPSSYLPIPATTSFWQNPTFLIGAGVVGVAAVYLLTRKKPAKASFAKRSRGHRR